MTTRRQVFGIRSVLELGRQLLKPVPSLLVQARVAVQAKRRGLLCFQPCLEVLEDRITPSDYSLTTLANFNSTNAVYPLGLVEDKSGNLFGTTELDGANNDGTVFEVAAGSGTITTLATFNGTNGASPHSGAVEDSNGNLFGTTVFGGANNDGTVFEVAAGSGTITTLATFNGTNGANPYGGVVEDRRGNLFGAAFSGGTYNDGTVFEVAAGSGTITTLATFDGTNDTNGNGPDCTLVEDSSGDLFGTTQGGGASGQGTVWEVAAGSGTITTLASSNAAFASSLIEDSSGNLFGTTNLGGASGYGTVFEVAAGSGTMTTLASFDGGNGAYPNAGLVEDKSGNLFGNTELDGANNDGTVFEVAAGSGTITTITGFDGSNGAYPYTALVEDSSGNLFGTTFFGGAFGNGTVFELTPAPDTWTGEGSNNLWSNPDNWSGNSTPAAGDNLVFPSGALQETNVNDLGYTFGSITTADDYSFSGQLLMASSLDVTQDSLELDSPTTVTNSLSVAPNTTLVIGSGITAGNLTMPDNATLSLDGRLIVNVMATLQDNGTVTISSEGVLDDFGTVNVGQGGTLTGSQGLLLVAPGAILSDSGTLNVSNDASLADEGTITVINSGTLTNSGAMSVGNSDVLSISNGSMTESPGAAIDVEGNITDNSGSSLTIEGYLDLDGIDDGLDMPGDGLLISTPVTSTTPTSTRATEIAHQVAAMDALPFETIKVLAEDAANQSASDLVDLQGAEKLASWADKAHYFGLTTEYSSDISPIITAYNNNDPDTFADKYSHLVEDMVGDLASATAATPLKNQACDVDYGLESLALNLMALISGFANKQQVENYYNNYLAAGVTADGYTIYNALKTRSSTAGPGVGGTLNDQGSVTVSPTGTLSDQDAITVGPGASLSVFGNLIEGTSGAQQVFGTLVVEPAGTLDIIGAVSVELGGSFVPLGTVSVAPGGIANLSSGVNAFGNNLYIVGGQTSNDQVQVQPVGASQTGGTGVQVNARLNGVAILETFNQAINAIYFFGYAGNDNVNLVGSLAINSYITAGNGNDNVIAGNGNDTVTLGNGNDNVIAGNGNNSVTLGNGNDNVIAGNGNNAVTLGIGNDNTLLGNGNNVVVEGNGHDNILAGSGDNLIVAGLGQHIVLLGNGSNILIDGSVQLTQIGDSLLQVLTDWITYGATASNVASIRSRLAVTYNNNYVNTLIVGRGMDWFWATYARDFTNRKATDLLN